MIHIQLIENIEIAGIDPNDAPEFCDAYFLSATMIDSGRELSEDELDGLKNDYPEVLTTMAFESFL